MLQNSSTSDYTPRQLDEAIPRSAAFIQGVSAEPIIYETLRKAGFTRQIFDNGRKLLFDALALPPSSGAPKPPSPRDEAEASLDAIDESLLGRIRAHLSAGHKQTLHFLVGDLEAGTGSQAVNNVATFLQRRAVLLRHDPSRASTFAEDDSALALLAERGIDDAECARLQKLVDDALTPAEPAASTDAVTRVECLTALRRWYDEWAGVAKALIRKRAHLIRLGLAKRRSPKPAEPLPSEPSDADDGEE